MTEIADLHGKVALVGICSDINSSFKRGAAKAPQLIRQALHNGSSNWTAENGIDLSTSELFLDVGDHEIPEDPASFLEIEKPISELLARGARPLILGGDHAITYPVMRSIAHHHGPPNILHFDAHSDLYDEFDGNRLSHACPFARIMESGLATRLVQVGIRTGNSAQTAQARRFGVEVHEMRDLDASSFEPLFKGPLYISFDMDSLDPAFAPGVSHFEPGGLAVRDVLNILRKVKAPVIGADIVEYNPVHDIHARTAMVGAKMVKELAGLMLAQG